MNGNKPFARLLAMLLCFALILSTAPITAMAEGESCTHVHDGICGYVEGIPCGYVHEHDGNCGYDADSDSGCADAHVHDGACGYIEAVPCAHVHDENCGGLALGDSGNIATSTDARIAFDIPLNEYGETVFYLTEGIEITDADLLDGVSAADEIGGDVAVTVKDAGGLDMQNPKMGSDTYPNIPYIITYAAEHPVSDEVFTATRELYVTAGAIMPLANVGNYSALLTECANTSGDAVVTLTTDITDGTSQLTINRNLTLDLAGKNLMITLPNTPASNGIKIASGVTLTIKDSGTGGTLTVTNTYSGYISAGNGAGINTSDGTLIIESGIVNATGGSYGAGIGGGSGGTGGNITISGGNVTATGVSITGGAGIGGGRGGTGGNITISGGNVTAIGSGAGIGGGDEGAGGNITITGSAVIEKAQSTGSGAGIGGEGAGGTITISGSAHIKQALGSGAGIGGGGYGSAGGDITIKDNAVIDLAQGGGGGAGIGGGSYGAGGNIIIQDNANVTAIGGGNGAGIGGGINGAGGNITITGGTVNATGGDSSNGNGGGAGIGGGSSNYGDVPAISGASGSITISGTANVTATGGSSIYPSSHAGAGIGSGGAGINQFNGDGEAGAAGDDSNPIIITSPNVTATGGAGSNGANAGSSVGQGGTGSGVGAALITIDTQPAAATTVTQGSISGSLIVAASVYGSAQPTFSYQWYSSSGGNSGGSSISSATGTTFAIPTTLTAGTYYYYCEVSAVDAMTAVSDVAVVTVNPTVPGAPTLNSATPDDAQITLSWSAPNDDGGRPITKYQYSTDGTNWKDLAGASPQTITETSAAGSNPLVNGTQYSCSVRAVNAVGESVASNSINATPMTAAATPTANPAGGTYSAAQTVTLTTTTGSATIYYTIDGTDPKTSGTTQAYSAPFSVPMGTALKAYATATGYLDSAVMTEVYTQMGTVAAPKASPAGGEVSAGTQVTLSCTEAGATIHYTTDNSTPTASSATYNGPITVSAAMTIKAIAVKTNMVDSVVMSESYTIKSTPNPPYNPGSSSDNDSAPVIWQIEVTAKPNFPTTARLTLTTAPDKNGVLTSTITEDMVKQAIDKAKAQAKTDGRTDYGYALEFDFSTDKTINGLNITFSSGALALLEKEGVKETTVLTNTFRFGLDLAAIKQLNSQSGGRAVTVSAERTSKFSIEAGRLIGSRPTWDINIRFKKDGTTYRINSLGKGFITMGMKYAPTSAEKTGNLAVVYVPSNGKPQILTASSYDGGWMIWQRSSLSVYGVGYIADAPVFTDTVSHWAKDNIDFVAGRGLLTGTSSTTFSPDTAITRAMFITALGRLSGADVSGYKTSSFTDVPADSYYLPYIEWAVANKIVSGTGGGKFSPNSAITREDMAVMMQNYAKATGYTIPVSRTAITFADASSISSYAKDAVTAVQQAGIIVGRGNNQFAPKASATRAEAATILHRFVELVIDEGTARGWVQNDAGQWQYVNSSGKAVTSNWLTTTGGDKYYFDDKGVMVSGKWVQIGGKWYYFYADGKLAVNTSIDGYTVGEDGARK